MNNNLVFYIYEIKFFFYYCKIKICIFGDYEYIYVNLKMDFKRVFIFCLVLCYIVVYKYMKGIIVFELLFLICKKCIYNN